MIEFLAEEMARLGQHQDKRKALLAKLLSMGLRTWTKNYGGLGDDPQRAEFFFGTDLYRRHASTLAYIGFADELNMDPKAYVENIVQNLNDLDTTDESFNWPIVVDPRIELTKVAEKAGVKYPHLYRDKISDVVTNPNTPYLTAVRDPFWYRGYNPKDVFNMMKKGETGCTLRELLTFAIEYPDFMQKYSGEKGIWLAAAGSNMKEENEAKCMPSIGVHFDGSSKCLGILAAVSDVNVLTEPEFSVTEKIGSNIRTYSFPTNDQQHRKEAAKRTVLVTRLS